MAVHPSRTVVAVGEVRPRTDDHRWARTGPARPVDNAGGLAAGEVARRTEGACGPGRGRLRGPGRPSSPPGSRRLPLLRWTIRAGPLARRRVRPRRRSRGLALDLAFPGTGWWFLAAPGVAAWRSRSAAPRPGAGPCSAWSPGWPASCRCCTGRASTSARCRGWRWPSRRPRSSPCSARRCRWRVARARRAARDRAGRRRRCGCCRRRCAPGCRSAASPGAGWRSRQADAPFTGLAALGGAPLVDRGRGARRRAASPSPSPRAPAGPGLPRPAGAGLAAVAVAASRSPPRGRWRCASATAPAAPGAGRAVAAVQGNVPSAGLDFIAQRRAVLDNHVRAHPRRWPTRVRAGDAPQPDLVIWPENSTDIDPLRNPDAYAEIDQAVTRHRRAGPGRRRARRPGRRTSRNAGHRLGPGDRPRRGSATSSGTRCRSPSTSRYRVVLPARSATRSTWSPRTSPRRHGPASCRLGPARSATSSASRSPTTTSSATPSPAAPHAARRADQQRHLRPHRRDRAAAGDVAAARGRARPRGARSPRPAASARSSRPTAAVAQRTGLFTPDVLDGRAAAARPGRRSRPARRRARVALRSGAPVAAPARRARSGGRRRSRTLRPEPGADGRSRRRRRERVSAAGSGRSARVLVIIPTYNEPENLAIIVAGVRAAVPEAHVLVADDNSPDGTGKIADELAAADDHVHVLHRPGKEGLGAAYLAGFALGAGAGYDVLVEMDADGSHQPEQLPRLLDRAGRRRPGARLALGAAAAGSSTGRSRASALRGGNLYARLALGIPLQRRHRRLPRLPRGDAARSSTCDDVASQGYCFQVDLAWRAVQAGFRVVEVPDHLRRARARRVSKMSRRHRRRGAVAGHAWGARAACARAPAAAPPGAAGRGPSARAAAATLPVVAARGPGRRDRRRGRCSRGASAAAPPWPARAPGLPRRAVAAPARGVRCAPRAALAAARDARAPAAAAGTPGAQGGRRAAAGVPRACSRTSAGCCCWFRRSAAPWRPARTPTAAPLRGRRAGA